MSYVDTVIQGKLDDLEAQLAKLENKYSTFGVLRGARKHLNIAKSKLVVARDKIQRDVMFT